MALTVLGGGSLESQPGTLDARLDDPEQSFTNEYEYECDSDLECDVEATYVAVPGRDESYTLEVDNLRPADDTPGDESAVTPIEEKVCGTIHELSLSLLTFMWVSRPHRQRRERTLGIRTLRAVKLLIESEI